MRERELILPPDELAHGHVRLELIDPRTSKTVERVEAENYISSAMLNHNRWRQRQEYRNTVASTDAEPTPNLMTRVVLSDSDLALPTGNIFAPGQITAWASPSSGTTDATRKGSFVTGQSAMTVASAVYTFEWPTTAGNGWIRSVYWTADGTSLVGQFTSFSANLPNLGTTTSPACWYDGAGGMWVPMGGNLVKYAWAPTLEDSSAPTVSITGPTQAQTGLTYITDIVGDGTNLYVVGSGASTIRKFPTPTGTGDVTESAITVSGVTPLGLAYDGAYLWTSFGNDAYRVDKSTGAIERSFSIAWSGVSPASMCWYPPLSLLLVSYQAGSGFAGSVRGYDLDGVVKCQWAMVNSSQASPANTHGLCYVGQVTDSRYPGFTYDGIVFRNGNMANYGAPGLVGMPGGIATYSVLPTEVEKTNLTGMKLTYTFTFS